jgi:ferredoxin
MYEFEFRTGKVSIDYGKCDGCASFACVKACSLYGRNILRVQGGKPVLSVSPEEVRRLCIECLACEQECYFRGQQALTIVLPIAGLDRLRG